MKSRRVEIEMIEETKSEKQPVNETEQQRFQQLQASLLKELNCEEQLS